MMGRIGERHAAKALSDRGYTVLGGLTRGNNGIDLIAQKVIAGRLQTFIFEVKVNGSRLSELQRLGADGYARDVLRRFADPLLPNFTLIQRLARAGTIRGFVIRVDWRGTDVITTFRNWI
jgi:hypothetical protein